MKDYRLNSLNTKGMTFCHDDYFYLTSFFGIKSPNAYFQSETAGVFFLNTDAGRFEAEKLIAQVKSADSTCINVTFNDNKGLFEINSSLVMDEKTGVFSRKDTLTNKDSKPHTVYSCVARFPLHGDDYEIHGQSSGWCAENDGSWRDISAGVLELTNSEGKSVSNGTPFALVRKKSTGFIAAIHVLPVGNWVIRAAHYTGSRTSYTVLEAGLSDRNLHMTINPGETLELPEILLYGFEGDTEQGNEILHRYLLNRYDNICTPPVYNTWFFHFDKIEPERLKEQVRIAKTIGCRYFVVDAGWFGTGLGWGNQVGNWVESTESAFCGGLKEFSDYVRTQGLKFGLWMEPERACEGAPVYKEHPEWFVSSADIITYDLANKEVEDYLVSEIMRLVKTYRLDWMKVDFNLAMKHDNTGSNFYRYYNGSKSMILRAAADNPECNFEGCAGGGLRTDIESVLKNFRGHFISDTVHPVEVLRMRQNGALRILPQYLGSWVSLYETPFDITTAFDLNLEGRRKLFPCGDATWTEAVDLSADFTSKALIAGSPGISGDLATLSQESIITFKKALEFYEKNRGLLMRSVCHLHTKVKRIRNQSGWIVFQYENIDGEGSLIFAFRLKDDVDEFICYPKNIDMDKTYKVTPLGGQTQELGGKHLITNGLGLLCPGYHSAQVVEITPL